MPPVYEYFGNSILEMNELKVFALGIKMILSENEKE
jgi:hypothetical protein